VAPPVAAEAPAPVAAPPEPAPAAAPVADVAPLPETAPPPAEPAVEEEEEADSEPPQDLRQYLVVRPDTPVVMFPDEIEPPRAPPIQPKILVVPPAPQSPPWLAWAGSIGLLVVLIAGAIVFRGPVMKVWPPSARVYNAIGLSQ
jgi:hypothetical protein